MATQRLSKLQKWILIECFGQWVYKDRGYPNGLLLMQEIFRKHFQARNNNLEATVSRSLKNLLDKKLIIPLTTRVLISKKARGFDYAQSLAIRYQRAGRTQAEWQEEIDKMVKINGKNATFLDISMPGETIKALTLTDSGMKVGLMLSNSKVTKLNNKKVND